MTSSIKRSRARRVLGVIGSVVGATVTFVASAAAATVIHLDMPVTRHLVMTQVNGILGSTLAGNVHIDSIGHVGLDGIDGVRVHVRDPEGVQVLDVDGVRVRVRGLAAARSALFGKGPIVIDVPSVFVGNVDANLDGDGRANGGSLRIANAFAVKNPTPSDPNAKPGRGVRVEAPDVKLGHAWVHGTPPGAQLVDADLTGLVAHAHVDPDRIKADLDRVGFETRAVQRGLDPKGTLGGKFGMPMVGSGMDVSAVFDGKVGGMPTTAKASMSGNHVEGQVDVTDSTGANAQAVVSEVAIHEALTVHVEAKGDLPHIEGKAHVALGRASVDAKAIVDTGATTKINATVAARDVDVSAVQAGAPKTELGLDATANLAIHDGTVDGTATVDTLPGLIDNQPLPRVEVRSKLAGQYIQVRARIQEPTMPTEVSIDLSPRTDGKDGQSIVAAVQSKIPDLHRVPEVGPLFGGSATIDAKAHLMLPEKTIEAKAKVTAAKVRDHELSIGVATVQADVHGTLDRPVIDADVHSSSLLTGAIPLAKLDASARITIADKAITIENPKAEAIRLGSAAIRVNARTVRIEGPSLRVVAAEIRGLGEPIRADVSKNGNDIDGTIDAPAIDLPLVTSIIGMKDELAVRSGTLSLKADGGLHGANAKAKVHGELRNFSAREVKTATADFDAEIDGRKVGLDLRANVGDAGNIALRSYNLVIGGSATDPNAWKRAHGRLEVDGLVDMAKVAGLLPPDTLPVADLRGTLTVQGRIGRDGEDAPPEIQMHAHTNGLVLAGKSATEPPVGTTRVETVSGWRSVGVDIGLDVRNDATSGLTNVAFHASDPHGMLVSFDSKTTLPYAEIARNPAIAKDRLFSAPISARIVIPSRRFDQLPPVLGTKDIQGAFEAELEATGTVLDPRVRFVGKGRGLRAPAMPADLKADTDIALDYDGKNADLAVKMRAKGEDLLTLSSRVTASSKALLQPTGAPFAWTASTKAHLASFPLETVPQLAQQRVRGRISGDVSLDGLHEDARVKGHIALDGLRVGRVQYEKGSIDLDAGGGKLAAKVRIDQKDGFIDASASSGLAWGKELAPKLDDKAPLEAKLVAKAFRAAAIQPFIQSAVPVLDGRIDADASARVVPGTPGAQLQGKVTFRDGTMQIAAIGDELRNVRATVSLAPDGTIKVDDVSAAGVQGEIHANATAKIDGMRLADATANIDIPTKKAFDFSLQGQPLGQISGSIKVKASQSLDSKTTTIGVEIPKLAVELPQVTKTGVETLEPRKNIRIGVYRDRRDFVKLPLDKEDTLPPKEVRVEEASRLEIGVKIGRVDVTRGNQAHIALTGNLQVSSGADTRIRGSISAIEGWADLQGKKFEIEKATVTFQGEPEPNPVVLATAGWVAADGTHVYADFVGPVKTGKVVLRSEPARPQNEILALVLFGTADGANPKPASGQQSSDGTTKAAVGVGGGVAAQGLTDALDDLSGLQVTARIDSTNANNPTPELEFQVSSKVSVAFGHVIGTPPITEPDTNLAKVEYRFYKNWSLDTTVGDRGKGQMDAVWKKRY